MEHIAYLDNSSTTKPCEKAKEYINRALETVWGNPSSLHILGMEAETALNEARKTVADSVSARPDEIFFTGSGTEANNTALLSVLKAKKRGGRRALARRIAIFCKIRRAAHTIEHRSKEGVACPISLGSCSSAACWR